MTNAAASSPRVAIKVAHATSKWLDADGSAVRPVATREPTLLSSTVSFPRSTSQVQE